MKKVLIIGFVSLFASFSFSQNPGNVGTTNLTAWWASGTLPNGNVTSWTTTYPVGGSAVTVSDGSSPYPQATNTPPNNIFNYNTVVDFNGNTISNPRFLANTTAYNFLTNQIAGNVGTFFTIYAAPASSLAGNDGVVCYKNASDAIQLRSWGRIAIGTTNSSNGTRDFAPEIATKPVIIAYKGNKSGVATMTAFKNDFIFTGLAATSSAYMDNPALSFGAKSIPLIGYGEHFEGYLSEVIFYNRDLTNAEINRVNSYLAIKYGVTLDNTGGGIAGDYTSTNSTNVWDASVGATYHNNVIGIARDDNGALMQKQSHTFDDITRIYIGSLAATNTANTGTFSLNNSYVIVGSNTGLMCATNASNAEIPGSCSIYSRLEREWKLTKTNFTQTFSLDLKLSNCAQPAAVNVSHLRLLVDDDGNFSNGGTTCYSNGDGTGISISYSNPTITVSGLTNTHFANASTSYFTIASTNIVTPLPVELITFKTFCNENEGKAELRWEVESEQDEDYYTIEKSLDGISFSELIQIDAKNLGNVHTVYSYVDEERINGLTTYYRLKQTDMNGESDVLAIESVDCSASEEPYIYPNPVNNEIHLVSQTSIVVEILDMIGQTITSFSLPAGDNIVDFYQYDSGSYLFKIVNTNNEVYIHKVIKNN